MSMPRHRPSSMLPTTALLAAAVMVSMGGPPIEAAPLVSPPSFRTTQRADAEARALAQWLCELVDAAKLWQAKAGSPATVAIAPVRPIATRHARCASPRVDVRQPDQHHLTHGLINLPPPMVAF